MTETKTCKTCGRPLAAPYRRIVNGKIVEGCVTADHDGHLYGAAAEWHNRPVAKQIRKDMKVFFAARGGK